MPAVARLDDTGSHGGKIVTGSPDARCNGRPIARVGDIYACPIHGPNKIVAGSSAHSVNRRKVARIGDPTECGAVITSGSPDHHDE